MVIKMNILRYFETEAGTAIIAALIGAIVSMFVTYYNMAQQKKLTQKTINAELIAHSRIEGILELRKHTAELIALYYSILKENNKTELIKKIIEAKMHSDLLIMYFEELSSEKIRLDSAADCYDDDSNEFEDEDHECNDLIEVKFLDKYNVDRNKKYDEGILNETVNNDNKHRQMILLIEDVFNTFEQYVKDFQADKFQELINNLDDYEDILDEEGHDNVIASKQGDELSYEDVKEYRESYYNVIQNMEKTAVKLRDYIGLYLSIQWKEEEKRITN